MANRLVCTPRTLPAGRRAAAVALADELFGADRNAPDARSPAERLLEQRRRAADPMSPAVIAVVRRSAWGRGGVRLTTGFMDNPSVALRREILRHLNMWSERANVKFVYSADNPRVRIARETGPIWGGYWSYLGTDILAIPADEPTMNLEGFHLRTTGTEFRRVVCHEAGHTLGFPHEHMRAALVQRIDKQKAYAYFRRTDGWTKRDVDEQVLTPLAALSLLATPVDQTSIMCYQLPDEITVDGKPILGGTRINRTDHAFAAHIYPKLARGVKTANTAKTAKRVKKAKSAKPTRSARPRAA